MRMPRIPVFPAVFAAAFIILGVLYAIPLLQAETIPGSPSGGPSLFQSESIESTAKAVAMTDPAATLPTAAPAALRIIFPADESLLGIVEQADLKAFADTVKAANRRIQIVAYGGTAGDFSSNARRLALKRALAVHDYLVLAGLSDKSMDVRALGGVKDSGPENRVDILNIR